MGPVDHIIEVARRGAGLTRQLLALSHRGGTERRLLDMHALLEEVFRILERVLDDGITIVRLLEAEHCLVTGNEAELESALVHLVLHAQETMSEGQLTVRTAVVSLDETFCRSHRDPAEPGDFFELSIGNTGIGMSPAIIAKIFAPVSEGVRRNDSLGLPTVYETVKGHKGLFTVYSEPELGNMFKLHLPLTMTEQETRIERPRDKPVKGEGLILLVEDERIVREIAVTMLEQFGYGVIEAVNGQEAIDKYTEFGEDIDLVILDMEMPVMGGHEALERLNQIDPAVRILIASGYSLDNQIRALFASGRVRGFIQKPYLMVDFSRMIAEILGDRPALLN
jgi:CheY-like chemotaxis protein